MSGTLYGVGLGPGDPELMTLKAVRLISKARVIAYPALAGSDSFARSIAAEILPVNVEEIRVDIPMTPARAPAQRAYDAGAVRIADRLTGGQDVVFLCEGDPLFYGSFMYMNARLCGRFPVQTVPGVTSVTAGAAAVGQPLSARNEVLTIIPGPLDEAEMEARILGADAMVIMKVGRHLAKIRAVLDRLGLLGRAHYVERATLGTERVMPLTELSEPAPYFSMILLTKGDDPWLKTRL